MDDGAPDEASEGEAAIELRCRCKRLLARRVDEGIELRCPRCKGRAVLTWAQLHELQAGEGGSP